MAGVWGGLLVCWEPGHGDRGGWEPPAFSLSSCAAGSCPASTQPWLQVFVGEHPASESAACARLSRLACRHPCSLSRGFYGQLGRNCSVWAACASAVRDISQADAPSQSSLGGSPLGERRGGNPWPFRAPPFASDHLLAGSCSALVPGPLPPPAWAPGPCSLGWVLLLRLPGISLVGVHTSRLEGLRLPLGFGLPVGLLWPFWPRKAKNPTLWVASPSPETFLQLGDCARRAGWLRAATLAGRLTGLGAGSRCRRPRGTAR